MPKIPSVEQNYQRQVLAKASKLVKLFDSELPNKQAIAAMAAIISLAKRGICPAWLHQSELYEWFCQLCCQPIISDDTAFADRLTGLARPLLTVSVSNDLKDQLVGQMGNADSVLTQLLLDPCFAGWIYQASLCKPRKSLLGLAAHANVQSARAEDIDVSDLPALTQWFSPPWISRFLIDETVGRQLSEKKPILFCDPACGAGNILIECLRKLFANYVANDAVPPAVALSKVLESEMFGFDIDPFIVEIAAFSLYLACRDLAPPVELPLPNIFHFATGQSAGSNADIVGSFLLGIPKPDLKLNLQLPLQVQGLSSVVALSQLPKAGDYTAIAANPPYLSQRLMPKILSEFLNQNYPAAKFDMYSAFLELSTKLLGAGGRMGIICQQSFLSTKRYAELRKYLLSNSSVESLVLLGSGTFAAKPGEKVSNAIFVAKKNSDSLFAKDQNISPAKIKCWRLLAADQKRLAEDKGIASLPFQEIESIDQEISDCPPFAFWCPKDIAKLFDGLTPMESADTGIELTNGLFTCNNDLFVKHFWQVPLAERDKYATYDKGGGHKWYRKTPYLVLWGENGEALRNYRFSRGQSRALPGERFYFQSGITYSYIGTRGFKARLLSERSVFDIASSSLFSKRIDLFYILGFLNSSLARFMLGVLNPTVNFQIGDLRRLPFIEPPPVHACLIGDAARQAVELAVGLDSFDPLSPEYKGPALLRYGKSETSGLDLKQSYLAHVQYLNAINCAETKLQSVLDDSIFELYGIEGDRRREIKSDFWVSGAASHRQLCAVPSFKHCLVELVKYLDETGSERFIGAEIDLSQANRLRRTVRELL